MPSLRVFPGFMFVLAVLASLIGVARAQTTSGSIQGTVFDSTGAVVPGVGLVATRLDTNVATRTVTTSSGLYVLRSLAVGQYALSATSDGFKKYIYSPVVVSTGTTETINVTLEVGSITDQVEVIGSGPSLNATSAEVGTVMESRSLLDLPLSVSSFSAALLGAQARQMEEFIFLVPGVTGNMWSKSVNGSPGFTQEVLIDGASAMDSELPGRTDKISPPYEAVQEFKVHTSNYSAEYGRGLGVMNFTMKSGTNEFHGGVFEFFRNDALDARGFFASKKAPKRQNEFGGTIGGPIVRNKSFFFFAYTGFRVRGQPANLRIFTLPTLRQRAGDFGEFLESSGIGIYDPDTTAPDGNGNFEREPFVDNIVPQSRWSRIATQANSYWPDPDTPALSNNYISREIEDTDQNNYSLKLDHTFNDYHKIFGSGFWGDRGGIATNGVDGPWNPQYTAGGDSLNLRLGYNAILSPTLINDFVAGLTRYNLGRIPVESSALDPYGIPGLPVGVKSFPTFTFTGYRPQGNSSTQPSVRADTNISVRDTLSYVHGSHETKVGFSYQGWRANQLETINDGGWFYFGRGQTSQPNSPTFARDGNAYAAFLLGDAFQYARLVGGFVAGQRVKTFSWFAEDSWKIRPNLTFTYGLRHDVPLPVREVNDRMSMFSPEAINPATGLPGALIFAGEGKGRIGEPRFVKGVSWRHLGPRLSLAYQLSPNMVIRTGYGITYGPGNASVVGTVTTLYKQGFVFDDRVVSQDAFNPVRQLDEGFPAFTHELPLLDATLANGRSVDYMNSDAYKMPYQQQWNFTIERELGASLFLTAGYVGNKGTNLAWGGENLNQVDSIYLSLGPLLSSNIYSPEARGANIPIPYEGFEGTVAQALRPFPHVQQINDFTQPTGNSTYHSLQTKLQRRFGDGYHFLVSYTLSKSISPPGATSGLGQSAFNSGIVRDTYNRSLDKSISLLDQTHNLVFSGGVELPFGRGKSFLNRGGLATAVFGGWMLNAVARYASGFPLQVTGGSQLNLFGGGNTPNRVLETPMKLAFDDPATDRYVNAEAFVNSAPYTFGTLGVVVPQLRGFAVLSEDISLLKRTPLTERVGLEFRAEFFNIFNRTQFRDPSTDANNPTTFGQVAGQVNYPRGMQFALKLVF